MKGPRRFHPGQKRFSKRPRSTPPKRAPLRAGADPRLKNIFSKIGRPAPEAFSPDPFQLQAREAIRENDCLVTAPTGAGKTWIAVQAIETIFEQGARAWYASPLKALTNAKFVEFSRHFGEANVGILTGDRKENPNAPIVVGTTEILRNQLYDAMHHGEQLAVDLVVLDEAHYLGDADRGMVWEEIMIYLPRRIPLLMLSATIGNAHQIAAWLTATRSKLCQVVAETRRPVPLFPLFQHPAGTLLPLLVNTKRDSKSHLYKKVRSLLKERKTPALAAPGQLPPFGMMLKILRKYNLLPAIFFLKSRADCDHAVQLCRENQVHDPDRAAALQERIFELLAPFPHVQRHRQRRHLEQLAVGSHHSGQLPAWKQVLEHLMSEGLLDAIFATSTVAAGVDFPARTVAFLNSDRFNGREFMPLDATELHQMTGRAGRRGKDKVGFALVVPGKYMNVHHVARQLSAPPVDVHSQIRINFSMVLNLMLSHTPEQIKTLLHQSFAAFQRQGEKSGGPDAAHDHLWQDFQRHLSFLKETGFVDSQDRLTPDGLWASQLRIDHPLLVAEGLRQALLPQDDPSLLAAIMASFVNEKETDEHLDTKRLPKKVVKTVNTISRGLKGFAKYMQVCGFETHPLFYRPTLHMYAWASGRTWAEVIQKSKIAEGDLAMLVLRTADHLRHLKNLKAVFAPTAASAKQAIDLILRDPVIPDRTGQSLSEEVELTDADSKSPT